MEMADTSSQGKLDQLLHEGKITKEDYHQLLNALKNQSKIQDEYDLQQQKTEERKLCKRWNGAVIAGVCGGFADYCRIDPILIRVIAAMTVLLMLFPYFAFATIPSVIYTYFSLPIVLLTYIVLGLKLPWDDNEKHDNYRPLRFLITGLFLFMIFPIVLYKYLVVFYILYAEYGLKFNFIANCANKMWHGLVYYWFTLFLFIFAASLVYMACRKPILLKVLEISLWVTGVFLLTILILGTFWPLFTYASSVQ